MKGDYTPPPPGVGNTSVSDAVSDLILFLLYTRKSSYQIYVLSRTQTRYEEHLVIKKSLSEVVLVY